MPRPCQLSTARVRWASGCNAGNPIESRKRFDVAVGQEAPMNCYDCDELPGSGGMRVQSITAIGVCRDHGRRSNEDDHVPLCRDCSEPLADATPTPEPARRTAQ